MKKLLVILMVLVLSVALVACGGPTETEAPVDTGAPDTGAPDTEAPETEAPKCNGDDIHDVEVTEVLATCQQRGYRREVCKVCNTVVLETAYPKTACTPAAAVTCTTDSVCSVCGEVIEKATGHIASETIVQDLGCSAIYACAGEGCTETITVVKENAEHTIVLPTAINSSLTIIDGKICSTCSSCGQDVPVPEEVKLALNFDYATIAEEFAALNNDKISFYTKEDATKGPAAQTKTVGDRTVLYFSHANPLFIDYDMSLLQDAEIFTVTFDYCIGKAPYAASTAVSLFTFTPGMKNGSAIPGKSCPWAHTVKFDRTSLYFTDGKSSNTTEFFQPEIGKWYTITVVVDNTAVNSSGKNYGKAYVFIDGEYVRSSECTGCTQDLLNSYGGFSWRIGEMGNTHDPQYDNFKIAVIK